MLCGYLENQIFKKLRKPFNPKIRHWWSYASWIKQNITLIRCWNRRTTWYAFWWTSVRKAFCKTHTQFLHLQEKCSSNGKGVITYLFVPCPYKNLWFSTFRVICIVQSKKIVWMCFSKVSYATLSQDQDAFKISSPLNVWFGEYVVGKYLINIASLFMTY